MLKKIIFILLFSSFLFSQENLPLLNLQNQKYNQSFEKFYQNRSIIRHSVAQVLESELDAVNYIVGPGDNFKITILGDLESDHDCEVYPEGVIVIPTVGTFHVGGLSLKNAKDYLNKALKSYYINADISVNLTGLRKFRVYYTGEVKAPGTYFAQGSDRLSDIVEISVVRTQRVISEEQQKEVSTSLNDWGDDTRIEIFHEDSSKDIYDLTRFYKNADKSQNPYLKGGDVIYVPPIDLSDSLVTIEGNVEFEGVYQIKKDESLLTFLNRIYALKKTSNLENINIERDGRTEVIDLIDNFEKYKTYILKHKDKIMIQPIREQVYVRGEVFLPGAFPFMANYTARDYIGQAGATDNADDVANAVVYRKSTGEVMQGGDVIIYKGDTIVVPKRTREVIKDYISILAPVIYLGVNIYYIVTQR